MNSAASVSEGQSSVCAGCRFCLSRVSLVKFPSHIPHPSLTRVVLSATAKAPENSLFSSLSIRAEVPQQINREEGGIDSLSKESEPQEQQFQHLQQTEIPSLPEIQGFWGTQALLDSVWGGKKAAPEFQLMQLQPTESSHTWQNLSMSYQQPANRISQPEPPPGNQGIAWNSLTKVLLPHSPRRTPRHPPHLPSSFHSRARFPQNIKN